ncbi:MAG: magnesium transporter [Erysipelotrichaceae bacterium]|nr:magnesium transporter [Erysipelotrichaceae bacterium]
MNDELVQTDQLQMLIQSKNVPQLRQLFDEYNIVDLAEAVNELPIADIIFVFKTVTKDITGQLFSYLDNEVIEKLITVFNSDEIKIILNNLYSDDLFDFLQELPAPLAKKVLNSASAAQKKTINSLLSYQEDTAGSLMSTSYLELELTDTNAQAMLKIKKYGKKAETLGKCFVVDDNGILMGTVSLRDILFAKDETIINDIMDTDYIAVFTNTDNEDAAKTMQKYDENILAVTDNEQHMLGIITTDDVLDILQEEATEDIHKMAAITPIEYPYMEASSFKIAMSRLVWLLLLMVSYALSSVIITNNNTLLVAVPSLITFIPMLMDTSGNAGSQASAMVIRGIIIDNLTIKDFFRVFLKEVSIAVICGLVLFIVNMLRIIIFVPSVGINMALIVSTAVFFVVLLAKLTGGLFPLLALVIKMDPAVMAAPLITTACDAISLLTYFALARLWLHL